MYGSAGWHEGGKAASCSAGRSLWLIAWLAAQLRMTETYLSAGEGCVIKRLAAGWRRRLAPSRPSAGVFMTSVRGVVAASESVSASACRLEYVV